MLVVVVLSLGLSTEVFATYSGIACCHDQTNNADQRNNLFHVRTFIIEIIE
jgi:hypothetical protein